MVDGTWRDPTVSRHNVCVSKVLIVEDSEVIRASVVSALRSQGHLAHALADGIQLERAITANQPDLVILDVMLPGGRDGFELLGVVRKLSRAGVLMRSCASQARRAMGTPPAGWAPAGATSSTPEGVWGRSRGER